jgi:hypothetical protein
VLELDHVERVADADEEGGQLSILAGRGYAVLKPTEWVRYEQI